MRVREVNFYNLSTRLALSFFFYVTRDFENRERLHRVVDIIAIDRKCTAAAAAQSGLARVSRDIV